MAETNVNVQVGGPESPASVYKTVVLKGNQSFASQITKTRTKYVVKYNFDLNGATVTIPTKCLIEFDGGSISNGTLVGNNTILIYNQALNAIFSNVDRQGTFVYNNTLSGTFANRPVADDIYVGFKYFCTDKQTTEGATDGIEIIHKGNNVWVDALGRIVS